MDDKRHVVVLQIRGDLEDVEETVRNIVPVGNVIIRRWGKLGRKKDVGPYQKKIPKDMIPDFENP